MGAVVMVRVYHGRSAVRFWSRERPASRAACARETRGGASPSFGRPPVFGAIARSSSPQRRIARAWLRSAVRIPFAAPAARASARLGANGAQSGGRHHKLWCADRRERPGDRYP
jgi:hypothetical protein